MRNYHDIEIWKDVREEDWENWHWQMQNVITSLAQLEKIINLTLDEKQGVEEATKYLKMRITPHIISLMSESDLNDPLRLQFIPSAKELISIDDVDLFQDVNADDKFSPVEGLIHRYSSKVLIFPSNFCGAYCRYCFRRKLARDVEKTLSKDQIRAAISYIQETPEIEEVIFSGGDPLVLEDSAIDWMIEQVSKVKHVQIIRFHTRLPVTVPYRITDRLIKILSKYKTRFPIYIIMHIDSVAELSDPMKNAVQRLVDNGFPCLASCPLLKGINDNELALRSLWTELIKMRIKPYYLFHSDPVKGLKHFLVPISRGLEIIRNLYDRMSGLALPQYCFNAPGGGGHVLLSPMYVEKIEPGKYEITTFEGEKFVYNEKF